MKPDFSSVSQFETLLQDMAPHMASVVQKSRVEFGETWETGFEESLNKLFRNDPNKLKNAAKGYVRFALDSIRLQKRFEKERNYIPKTFNQAAEEVYNNREYMFELYLPGILLSHYLWPHHYRQLRFFIESFIPLTKNFPIQSVVKLG